MSDLVINKLLTPYNYTSSNTSRIKYIVIHYVGATGGAKANCQWYAGGYRGASAHYYVGFDGEYWQSVRDQDIAWAVGASSYIHPNCRNSNSISIEMCVRNKGSMSATSKDWYFEDKTVASTIELTKYLMNKYNIPVDNVIRHYDVTGKTCPNPYVYNHTKHTWTAFKTALNTPASGATTPEETFTATGKAKCIGKNVRVRETPKGPVIGFVSKGKRFKVDGKTRGNWVHIKVSGIGIGWMNTKYVQPIDNDSDYTVEQSSVYYVKSGDTLSSIAKECGVTIEAISTANGIIDPALIFVGEKLIIPAKGDTVTPNNNIRNGQIYANKFAGAGLSTTGIRDEQTIKGLIKCLQMALNKDYNAGLTVNGKLNSKTKKALGNHSVSNGDKQYLVTFVRIALMCCNGYAFVKMPLLSLFTDKTTKLVKKYQKSKGLTADGVVGRETILSFLS